MTNDTDIAEAVHAASLELLADPGVKLEHPQVLAAVLGAGGRPGRDAEVVRLPQELVAECLARCPRQVALADRRGGGRTLTATSAPSLWSCPGMYLYRRGQHRPFAARDMEETARLLDRLERVDVVFGLSLDDVPPVRRDVVGLLHMAQNTTKHIRVLCFSPEGAAALVEMRRTVGPDPWLSLGFTAHGPLRWTWLALEIYRLTAGWGLPVTVNGEPMAGASGPVTLAGSAAVGNAEILAGLVVNQVLEPGRPCMYNLGLAHTLDMRTGIAVTGGPENALLARASAALGRFYGLPSASWVSTESMAPDAQAALEKMFGFQTHVDRGVSAIWGVGQLESELTFSPAQAVIDDEMLGYIARYRRGLSVGEGDLALDCTRRVGIAGSFMEDDHTLEHYRGAFFEPRLLCRQRRAVWRDRGASDLAVRAETVAAELAAEPVDAGLDAAQVAELERLARGVGD